jgi:hypothetical protein
MDPVTIGGWIAALFLGLLNFRGKRGDVWKQEAEAYKAKSERLESDVAELRQEFADYKSTTDGRMTRLETENARLAQLASGHDAVVALAEIVERNHREVMAALGK